MGIMKKIRKARREARAEIKAAKTRAKAEVKACLLYTSDAADELLV